MNITGNALIGGGEVRGAGVEFHAIDPSSGEVLEPVFQDAGVSQIDHACALAAAAFDPYRQISLEDRARFLEAIAKQILAIGDALIVRAMAESGLPRARLEGERGRTIVQLQLFAKVVRDGGFIDARIDSALPDRQPPRPDLRFRMIGLGPVAVFGASNFPLAFSVAGGDTASALAAGCPVVVKGHPAHPGTSELVGRAIQQAVSACGMPAGVFSLLPGKANEVGAHLVAHSAIQAVGFTGSRAGGVALMAIAAKRPQPIPVYAEMSSINPMFLFPGALSARADELGTGLIGSLMMGVGQFCTSPGLVIGIAGDDFDRFSETAVRTVTKQAAGTMLTPAICRAYRDSAARLAQQPGVQVLGRGIEGAAGTGEPLVLTASSDAMRDNHALSEEVFGPLTMLVKCRDLADMLDLAEHLEGQLTITLQMAESDRDLAQAVLPVLERKAGRLLVNGYPTGVEVADAMVHGGPFPATSDSRTTSVGTAAITRFLRPVCYQNFSQSLLSDALLDANPLGIGRRIDGLSFGRRPWA